MGVLHLQYVAKLVLRLICRESSFFHFHFQQKKQTRKARVKAPLTLITSFDHWIIKGQSPSVNRERHQILRRCSLVHCQYFLKMKSKSLITVVMLFHYQTNNCQTIPQRAVRLQVFLLTNQTHAVWHPYNYTSKINKCCISAICPLGVSKHTSNIKSISHLTCYTASTQNNSLSFFNVYFNQIINFV